MTPSRLLDRSKWAGGNDAPTCVTNQPNKGGPVARPRKPLTLSGLPKAPSKTVPSHSGKPTTRPKGGFHKKKAPQPDVWDRLKKAETAVRLSLDELNEELDRAEIALCSLPVKWAADVEIDSIAEADFATVLSFRESHHNKWGLFVESGPEGDPEFWVSQPLNQASRILRVKAAEALPALLEEIVARAESESVRIQRARKRAAEFVNFMSSKRGSGDECL